MPSKERLKVIYVDQFLCSRRDNSNLPPRTISKYRAVITQAVDALDEAGLNCYPKKIGEKEINYLRKNHFVKNSQRYNRWKLSIFSGWLAWHHNDTLEKMRIPWPQDARINVDWLEPEEAIRMKWAAQGIEKLIVHLELDLGLRRIDMYRLEMSSIRQGYFDVLGKGRGGGKKRTVSWDDDTKAILEEYYQLRNEMIVRARHYNSKAKEPEGLLIYQKGKRLGQYQMTAIDYIVTRVAQRAGISRKITSHTLRRTCGRILYLSGADIESIAGILGHSETRTTLLYLGIRLDDQKKALTKRGVFLKNVEAGM